MHKGKRAAASEKKHQKNQLELLTSEVELILDDLRGEGVDIATAEGKAIACYVIAKKLAKQEQTADIDSDANFFGRGPLF
jgi:hypothetical protein